MAPTLESPSLALVLSGLAGVADLGRLDRLWVFPPRLVGEVESGLVVLSLRPEGSGEGTQREVVTVQYEARGGKGAPPLAQEVTGRGWAPAERVPQVIAGVVRRLGGQEEEPLSEEIAGDPARYRRFLEQLGIVPVDPANGE